MEDLQNLIDADNRVDV